MSWWRSQRSKTVELAQARTEAFIHVDPSGDLRIAVGVLLEEIAHERTRLDTALRFALAPDAGLESVSRVESQAAVIATHGQWPTEAFGKPCPPDPWGEAVVRDAARRGEAD